MYDFNSRQNNVDIDGRWNAFDALADPVVVFKCRSFEVLFANSAASFLADQLTIEGPKPLTALEYLGVSEHNLQAQISDMEEQQSASRLEIKHGTYHADVNVTLVPADTPEPVAIAVFRNISLRAQADQRKKELVSTVSHELRSPLTAIKGAMGLILSGAAGEIPQKPRQMVQICQRNADRLILIINDILDLDKIADGAMVFDNDHLDLSTLVNDAVEAVDGFKNRFDVSIDVDVEDTSLVSYIDPNRMLQVLVNLMSNAIKFSPAGASVTIRLSRYEDLNRISVIDRGEGIPLENHGSMFGRFVQIGASNRARTGGTGLGLSIVKAIVDNQGGEVSFESQVGKGTTFHVDLKNSADEQQLPASLAWSD